MLVAAQKPGRCGIVKLKLAVASCGKGNGRPHRETLELLAANPIEILRTDEVGTVAVAMDRGELSQIGRGLGRHQAARQTRRRSDKLA